MHPLCSDGVQLGAHVMSEIRHNLMLCKMITSISGGFYSAAEFCLIALHGPIVFSPSQSKSYSQTQKRKTFQCMSIGVQDKG